LILHKTESFQVPAIIDDVGPEAANQIDFGRKVLPDWVIASRARI
jgi:hypothetical protein